MSRENATPERGDEKVKGERREDASEVVRVETRTYG